MLLTLCLLTALVLSGAPQYHRSEPSRPFKMKWGPYIVIVERYRGYNPLSSELPERVRIVDRKGTTVREVRGAMIPHIEKVNVTGKGGQDLYISEFSGGAYCCTTNLIFTYRGGLRNLMVYSGHHFGVRDFGDIDRDGRQEIFIDSPALMDFSGWHFVRSPSLATILRWNGKRFIEVTRKYPQGALSNAQQHREEIQQELKDGPEKDGTRIWEWLIEGEITGYYANMLKIGRGREAQVWLQKHLTRGLRGWFSEYDREMRYVVATSTRRYVSIRNNRVLRLHSRHSKE